MIDLGARLKLLRKEKDVMQKEIAQLLDVSIRSYQYYESNKLEPNLVNLVKLADYFGVSLDYLVGRSDDPTVHKNK